MATYRITAPDPAFAGVYVDPDDEAWDEHIYTMEASDVPFTTTEITPGSYDPSEVKKLTCGDCGEEVCICDDFDPEDFDWIDNP